MSTPITAPVSPTRWAATRQSNPPPEPASTTRSPGSLSRSDYRDHVAPASLAALGPARATGAPLIHFAVGVGDLLDEIGRLGTDAVGVDWRIPLDEALVRIGRDVTVQGNIDPALLGAPPAVLSAHVDDVLLRGRAARAHVVNLGHGVPPETDPDVLTRLVETVHERG